MYTWQRFCQLLLSLFQLTASCSERFFQRAIWWISEDVSPNIHVSRTNRLELGNKELKISCGGNGRKWCWCPWLSMSPGRSHLERTFMSQSHRMSKRSVRVAWFKPKDRPGNSPTSLLVTCMRWWQCNPRGRFLNWDRAARNAWWGLNFSLQTFNLSQEGSYSGEKKC